MKRTLMKSRPKRHVISDEQREAMEAFGRVAQGNWCAVCGLDESYGLDVHHVVSQQQLRRDGLQEFMWDTRNALALCAIGGLGNGCHERHENASRRVPRRLLKVENEEFAAELGLEWYLERYYDSEVAA